MLEFLKKNIFIIILSSITLFIGFLTFLTFIDRSFIDLNQNLEFTLLSNTEILLIISPILKSDNFGSQLNLITLLFFIILNFRNHKNFSLILLSCPLIIYFISTQKLQLFFAILFLLLFILINKNLIKKKSELFILILLLTLFTLTNSCTVEYCYECFEVYDQNGFLIQRNCYEIIC